MGDIMRTGTIGFSNNAVFIPDSSQAQKDKHGVWRRSLEVIVSFTLKKGMI
jgi:hypothetical protein